MALGGPIGDAATDLQIRFENGKLTVSINGVPVVVDRDVSYWNVDSYFKTGVYPQAHAGTVTLALLRLTTSHTP